MRMRTAVQAYRAGNNAGRGYDVQGATVGDAANAIIVAGGELWLQRQTSDDVALVKRGSELVAIGGDAMGRNPWAVTIVELTTLRDGKISLLWCDGCDADDLDAISLHDVAELAGVGEVRFVDRGDHASRVEEIYQVVTR